jgi:uncharacterized membrane protein YraQ (UPF0718 family)
MLTTLIVFCILYAILCAIAVGASLTMSSQRATVENDLQKQGIRSTGRFAGQVSPTLSFTYLPFAYEYEGKTYKHRQWVSKHYGEAFLAGTSADVLFLPDKPEIAMLANISPDYWESQILKRHARTASILFCIVIPFLILLLMINR